MATKKRKRQTPRGSGKLVSSIMLSEQARTALKDLALRSMRTRSAQIEYLIMQAHADMLRAESLLKQPPEMITVI